MSSHWRPSTQKSCAKNVSWWPTEFDSVQIRSTCLLSPDQPLSTSNCLRLTYAPDFGKLMRYLFSYSASSFAKGPTSSTEQTPASSKSPFGKRLFLFRLSTWPSEMTNGRSKNSPTVLFHVQNNFKPQSIKLSPCASSSALRAFMFLCFYHWFSFQLTNPSLSQSYIQLQNLWIKIIIIDFSNKFRLSWNYQ